MSVVRGGSLRARLTRTLVGLGLASVVLLATVNFFVVRGLLDRSAQGQLESLRDTRADAVEIAMDRLLVRTAALASDPAVADALAEIGAAYGAIDDQLTRDELDELAAAYEPIVERYDAAGVERPAVDDLLPTSTAGRYVQFQYIAANPETDRSSLVDAGDGSSYSDVHARHHEFLRGLAASIGASDLLLVDDGTGEVVYSVSKRVDIGTDATGGPHAGAGLGTAVAKLDSSAVDAAVIADTSFYLPDSAAPVVHVAAAVRDEAALVGSLVITLRTDRLTDIVTASQQWDSLGLGDTGDIYVVGPDLRLRTVPRPWFASADDYLERFRDVTDDERTAGLIEFTGTPVLIQPVDNAAVQSALDGEPFVGGVDNYLARSTVAAASPLDVADLGWVLVTEQGSSEASDELVRFVLSILVVLAILLSVLTLVGFVLARALAKPIRPLVGAAGRIADGDYQTDLPDLGRNEFGDVARQLEAVAGRLSEQEASMSTEERRILKMLASVLPADLVERVRSGERDLAEIADDATVIALTIGGVPAPSGGEQDAVVELTTALADEIGRLAEQHGVERGQAALEQQLFVAGRRQTGTSANEAAAFSAAAIDVVHAIAADHGLDITARAALSAGPVATGVLGQRQVSFAVWGSAVTSATALSRRAADGQVLADSSLLDELGDHWAMRRVDGETDTYVVEQASASATPA